MEEICLWLSGFTGKPVTLEQLDYPPGETSLFPQGCRELEQRQDILGNLWLRCSQRFILLHTEAGQTDWPDRLCRWVQAHQAPPQLGINTRWRAENGRLRDTTAAGTAVYTIDLVAEYEKEKTHEN